MNSTLKSTPADLQNSESTYLKVVKSEIHQENSVKRIYINTLMPNFSYTNSSGALIKPKKCISL